MRNNFHKSFGLSVGLVLGTALSVIAVDLTINGIAGYFEWREKRSRS